MNSKTIQEPSVEEQIRMETKDLEQKCLELTQMLCNKDYEIEELHKALDDQKKQYEHAISELCLKVFK